MKVEKNTYQLILIGVMFLLGLHFCVNNTHKSITEGFDTSRCPNLLIKKDNKYYLHNTNKVNVPGVNPIVFNTLEEYTEFIEWQRSNGIRCPVLSLEKFDSAQGEPEYKLHTDAEIIEAGLQPVYPDEMKLLDAGHDDYPYNQNSYPSYDRDNQYIGAITPLDKMYNNDEDVSPNAMDRNWGGVDYSRDIVESGRFKDRTRQPR